MSVEQLNSYLAQINFPCDLNHLPKDAYLVGGSVRDALLGRYKVPLDLDFVLPTGAIETAKDIANLYGGGFVVLDAEREIARVVFDQGTLDLARQEGETLEIDLQRRDFTINAIAFNLQTQKLVDPLKGLLDLEQKTLRMISTQNLEDDPLRLLRAYRQAAQLEFEIEPNTRQAIRDRATLIKTVAAERVQAELNYLFTAAQGNRWLNAATEDGLLQPWLPHLNLEKVQQLNAVQDAITISMDLGLNLPDLEILTKLASLVNNDANIATTELSQLKYSRTQIKAVSTTIQYLSELQTQTKPMSLREQYFWFLAVKDFFPILIVRAIATNVANQIVEPLIERYLNKNDPVVYPQPLITGNDLINELQIKPSPLLGTILTEVQIAQIESRISTRSEAILWANSLLVNH